jgi:hypothetical protein
MLIAIRFSTGTFAATSARESVSAIASGIAAEGLLARNALTVAAID